MKNLFAILFVLIKFIPIAAQQNWAAIPCSKVKALDAINRMWVDSLHNEIIMASIDGYSICNITYKGIFAYNGIGFSDLDLGLSTHRLGASAAGDYLKCLIT